MSPRSTARRWTGLVLFGLALTVAVVLVWRFSGRPAADSGMAGMEGMAGHGTTGSPADTMRSVSLTAQEAQRIGVTFAAATEVPLERTVRAVALVTYDETRVRSISTKLEGWVEQLQADYTGRLVREGEPLLSLYAPMAVAAQQELELAHRLAADVRGGSEEARAGARTMVEAARQRLRYWDVPEELIAALEAGGEVRRTVTLHAPYGGFVLEKNVVLGQKLMAGDPLYRLADLSVVWLEGEVFERDLPLLRVGGRATATFPALPGEARRGRLSYLYPTINPETRTARVRVELANTGLALKPGMYGTLEFVGTTGEGLSVPRSAVLITGTRSLVFRKLPDGRFQPQEVAIGVTTDDRVQILRGLVKGDTVVASATFLVDAESNLGTLMGGMANMPGMDMTAPAKAPPTPAKPPRSRPPGTPPHPAGDTGSSAHQGHQPGPAR